ncbi:hypothetical protein GCM10023116_48430 [Kistimonas scapharcae]|uniref:Uncharacterized protein n=1 Tax=Kistimonas scapharcae TaxID=1036133 RepID=A0ABP8VAZ2_9GAMM
MTATGTWMPGVADREAGDVIPDLPTPVTKTESYDPDALKSLVKQYYAAHEAFKQIRDNLDELKQAILSCFPEEPGRHETQVDGFDVVASISERWEWDENRLSGLLAAHGDLPAWVRQTVSVDRRGFERLDAAEKAPFLAALTRKPGGARIAIKPASDS